MRASTQRQLERPQPWKAQHRQNRKLRIAAQFRQNPKSNHTIEVQTE
jgi:hypothetical protein